MIMMNSSFVPLNMPDACPLPPLPFKAGMLDTELYDPAFVRFGNIDALAIRSPKTKVGRIFSEGADFPEQLTARREDGYGSLAWSGDEKVSLNIAPHAIEPMVRKAYNKTLVNKTTIRLDRERPERMLDRFIDVQRLPIRADLDAISRSHSIDCLRNAALAVDSPDLTFATIPIRIACPQGSIRPDCEVIRLVHRRLMRKNADLLSFGIYTEDIVLRVISDVEEPGAVEPRSASETAAREFDPHLATPAWINPADGRLSREAHRIDISLRIARCAFDICSKAVRSSKRDGHKQREFCQHGFSLRSNSCKQPRPFTHPNCF